MRPPIVLASLFALGCAHSRDQAAAQLATSVALDRAHAYVVTSTPEVWILDPTTATPIAQRPTPCASHLDIEIFAEHLYLLCADASVHRYSLADTDETAQWERLDLSAATAERLQRSDSSLFRVEIERPDPPPEGTIRLDGPGPTHTLTRISRSPAQGPIDRWTGYDLPPSTANEAGDAFALSTSLHRHWQITLTTASHGNALCSIVRADVGWLRDVAVDPEGKRFAIVTDSTLILVQLDAGRVHSSAHDPRTGARQHPRMRCHR